MISVYVLLQYLLKKNLKVWEAFSEINLEEVLEEKHHLVQGDSSVITMDKIEDLAVLKMKSLK